MNDDLKHKTINGIQYERWEWGGYEGLWMPANEGTIVCNCSNSSFKVNFIRDSKGKQMVELECLGCALTEVVADYDIA